MDTILAQVGYGCILTGRDILMFPWWWYTRGVRGVLRWAGRTLRGWEQVVGLRFWARNLFVPMFGQTDVQGRLISVAMRVVVLIGRLRIGHENPQRTIDHPVAATTPSAARASHHSHSAATD